MKNAIPFITFLLLTMYASAQNVGIGTTAPAQKLTIITKNAYLNTNSLYLYDSSATGYPNIRFQNLSGTHSWLIGSQTTPTLRSSDYMDLRTDSTYILTLRGNGSVGINNSTPAYTLDVVGDINLSGSLRVSGNAGSAGNVLVSQGAGQQPVWQNASGSQVGFYATITDSIVANFNDTDLVAFDSVVYNDGSGFNTNKSIFTAPTSGLYHFDVGLNWQYIYIIGIVSYSVLVNGVVVNFNISVEPCYEIAGSFNRKLNAGDQVSLYENQTTGYSTNINPGPGTFFSGYKVY